MVLPEYRGSMLPVKLIHRYACDGYQSGIELDFIDCNKHLVEFFERMGYFSYRGWIFHKEFGTIKPMFLATDAISYLESIGSFLTGAAKSNISDEVFGGHDLIRRHAELPRNVIARSATQFLKYPNPVPQAMISIVFASTSGRTDEAARSIASAIGPDVATIIDLRLPLQPNMLPKSRVIIAGTPTYGRGDWHSAWREHDATLVPWLRQADAVFLFGLGSQHHHPNSFCCGLRVLHRFCLDQVVHVRTTGASEGFPGLVSTTATVDIHVGEDRFVVAGLPLRGWRTLITAAWPIVQHKLLGTGRLLA